jgi:hypothetical protein
MAKKWNKLMARIQALEKAIAGLISGKAPVAKKAKKKKGKKKKAKAVTQKGRGKAKKAPPSKTAKKARHKTRRVPPMLPVDGSMPPPML